MRRYKNDVKTSRRSPIDETGPALAKRNGSQGPAERVTKHAQLRYGYSPGTSSRAVSTAGGIR